MEGIKSERNVDIDRISALPDSILGVILSLLPTKNALATSALSKRWEFLWRTVHNLDFCLKCNWVEQDEDEDEDEDDSQKFVGYVNHVLLHHDARVLNKFRLVWTYDCVESHATSWIKTAITRNVHELSLVLCVYYGVFDMPISVFSCDSLRSLQLSGRRICLSASALFFLPRLESLDLDGVTFESDETFEKMIRGCPVLNYLHIDMGKVFGEYKFRFIISSTSLRRLELNLGFHKYLNIDASSLENLKIYTYDDVYMIFVQNNLRSLVKANLEINMHCHEYDDFEGDICNSMVSLVGALHRAKFLTLSHGVMRALRCATINLSADFWRLVTLKTTTCCCACSSLQDFIQRSDNLEVLTIHKSERYEDDENDHEHSVWTAPANVPICLSTSLKKVEIYGYEGLEDERAMICYMLQHGSGLEVVQISFNVDTSGEEFELLQEICEFPRMSLACEIKQLSTPHV